MNYIFEHFIFFFNKSVTVVPPEFLVCMNWTPRQSTRWYFRTEFIKTKKTLELIMNWIKDDRTEPKRWYHYGILGRALITLKVFVLFHLAFGKHKLNLLPFLDHLTVVLVELNNGCYIHGITYNLRNVTV